MCFQAFLCCAAITEELAGVWVRNRLVFKYNRQIHVNAYPPRLPTSVKKRLRGILRERDMKICSTYCEYDGHPETDRELQLMVCSQKSW